MSDKIDFFQGKLSRLILSNWLILLSFLFIVGIVNCSGTRSVRSGGIYTHSTPEKHIEEKNPNIKNDNFSKAIEEYENRIKSKKLTETKLVSSVDTKITPVDNDVNITNQSRIPTLREQMQTLAEDQKMINKRIDTVKNDIYEIKSILKNIQGSVDLMYDSQKITPETGVLKLDMKKDESINPKQKQNDYIILPDSKESNPNVAPKKLNKEELKKRAIAETFSDISQKTVKKTQKLESAGKQLKKSNAATVKNKKTEDIKSKESKNQELVFKLSDSVKTGINEYKSANYSKAIKILTSSINEETSLKNLSEIHYFIAESYFAIRDYKNSINYFTKVLEYRDSPYKPKAQLKIAESNMRSGRIPEAKIAYEKLIENYPESEFVPQARKMLQQL
jgi:TolA-binding protein